MKRFGWLIVCLLFAITSIAASRKWTALPLPLSNNAVAAAKVNKKLVVFSFMGIGAQKTWNAISNKALGLDTQTGKWSEIRPVPGPAGRLGSVAVTVKDVIYLLGGYTVDGRGDETTVRSVEVLVPSRGIWYRAADMPIPLDDSVTGVYRDRFIYTISGWSQEKPVPNVQVYDAQKDSWQQATPIPGTPVFGHAGGIVDDTIVYCDGAYKNPAGADPKYVASDECWMGKIDHREVTKLQWSKLAAHPGSARYRIAAAGSDRDQKIYFTGGTDNPYNFNGLGYNGRPAEPSSMTFAFNLRTKKWDVLNDKTPNPTMDNRGLIVTSEGLVTVGGMENGQKVTSRINVIPRK
jgi:N-acetylneuraminic acid mutarotase